MDKKAAETIQRAFREQAELTAALFDYMIILTDELGKQMTPEEQKVFNEKIDDWFAKNKKFFHGQSKDYQTYFKELMERFKNDKPN